MSRTQAQTPVPMLLGHSKMSQEGPVDRKLPGCRWRRWQVQRGLHGTKAVQGEPPQAQGILLTEERLQPTAQVASPTPSGP